MLSAILAGAALPAHAAGAPDSSFVESMSDSAPALLDDTVTTLAPDVSVISGEVEVSPSSDVLPTPESSEAILVEPPTFTVDYASSIVSTSSDGVVTLGTDDEASAAYIQPVDGGYRVISSTLDASGPSSFDYSLEIPSQAEIHQDGSLLFIESNATTFAVLELPWAKDALGQDVPTWYTLSNGVLTQHLDLTGISACPVLTDPARTYSYKFPTNKTSTRIEQLLRSCFNCYFPVDGGPRGFPAQGQLLPLTVGPFPFECRMGGIGKVTGLLFQYSFIATRNHVDGEGSTITFSFRSDQYLYVSATVMNWLMNNDIYRGGASQEWKSFADNLRRA